jgi:type II secretory pathway pseudopilin PulG
MTSLRSERGFTMIELLVASVTMVIVLGGAVAITSQVQQGYRRQLEDSAAEQEARYALDWIGKYIRAADNNPFAKPTSNCPGAATPIIAIQFDGELDGNDDNDIRLMTDSNPPDGLFGGAAVGACTQSGEDVTISLDDVNNTIVFLDNNTGGAVSTRTDTVIENLQFIYRNAARAVLATNNPANQAVVHYIETRITIRTRTLDARTGQPETRTLSSEVKVRSRT